jgi:hypothetical protein
MDEDVAKKPATDMELAEAEKELKAWQIVKVMNANARFAAVVRIRMWRPEAVDLSRYATAVEITWHSDGGKPLPSNEESKRQAAFAEAIGDLDLGNGFSRLMQVWTGAGVKEWLYYTSDRGRFMEVLNNALIGHERYPIEISFYDDPAWQIWQETVDAIIRKGEGA